MNHPIVDASIDDTSRSSINPLNEMNPKSLQQLPQQQSPNIQQDNVTPRQHNKDDKDKRIISSQIKLIAEDDNSAGIEFEESNYDAEINDIKQKNHKSKRKMTGLRQTSSQNDQWHPSFEVSDQASIQNRTIATDLSKESALLPPNLEKGTKYSNNPKSKESQPSQKPRLAQMDDTQTSKDKNFLQDSEESVQYNNSKSPSNKKNNNRLNILRMWLIFLIFCFIFEECALEIPGMATMDEQTKKIMMIMTSLIGVMILLVIWSFIYDINILYIVSIIMQVAFIMCDLKTTHHKGSPENHHVVRNACSGRLILMALETSHLTSMAIKTEFYKYVIVNIINVTMFSVLIFIDLKIEFATFWELGQISSIYVSAIVSLIIYHYLVERLNRETTNEMNFLDDQKHSFKRVVDSIQDGVLIVQEGKIDFMNKICNKFLSKIYNIDDCFSKVINKPIYQASKLFDLKIFKIFRDTQQENETNSKSKESKVLKSKSSSEFMGSTETPALKNQTEFSLREIMIMTPRELENKIFQFKDDSFKRQNMNKILKQIVKGLQYVNFVEGNFLPTFKQFQLKKIAIYDKINEVNPSFIVCFVDQSNKILAENSLKGESELVALINSTISHEMRNPLNIVSNHIQNIKDKINKFSKFFDSISGQVDQATQRIMHEFYTQVAKSNQICCHSSDKLILNIEDMLSFAQLKSGTFVKQNQNFDVKDTISEIIMIQKDQAFSKNVKLIPHFFDFPLLSQVSDQQHEEIKDFSKHNMRVFCDQLRLKQILMNIQSNALKFTKDNGEVHIVCQYVRGKKMAKNKFIKSHDDTGLKQVSMGALNDDDEYNESAESNQDKNYIQNDKAALFLDLAESQTMSLSNSVTESADSDRFRFEEQYSLAQVFKPEDDGRDKIVVSVIDSGIGMSKSDKAKLFKLFGALNNVDQNTNQGIGIGLTICERLVKAYQGRIGLRSKKGIGSQFSFSIPMTQKMASEKSLPDVNSKWELPNQQFDSFVGGDNNTIPSFQKGNLTAKTRDYLKEVKNERSEKQTGKILVVDDEQYNLDIIRMFIEMIDPVNLGGERVTYCQDGEKALNIIKNSAEKGDPLEYSLILSDCQMPFKDGYEATRQMRELWFKMGIEWQDQPQIHAITGHIEEHYIKKARDSGFDSVYAKPLHKSQLENLLFNMNFIEELQEQINYQH